jgi:hypothetical protein
MFPIPAGAFGSTGHDSSLNLYPDLSCSIWFVGYIQSANGAKFTSCLTAFHLGSLPLLFPALRSRSPPLWLTPNKNKSEKYKTMNVNQVRPVSQNSSAAGAVRSIPVNPGKPQRTAPSQTAIAKKAYEIWLSRGQERGCDQQHWFEAELQLQQA